MSLRAELRANNASNRLFLRLEDGKCSNRPIGINTIGSMPKLFATFLNLPEPDRYKGHCFCRISATLLVDGGADKTMIKLHTNHKSTKVAQSYIDNRSKIDISEKISKNIKVTPAVPEKKICNW